MSGDGTNQTAFDYVIVGGGSAGCVLAARLSENTAVRVLLLEAGGVDNHPLMHVPAGFAKLTSGPCTWGYQTAPQRHAMNRQIPFAQARVIGGGSTINAQVFTRGHPQDYDRWARDEGCDGWAFDEVKPYFLRSEGNTAIVDEWHSADGPLGVSDACELNPTTRAFIRSCQEFGMPQARDFNGALQEGAGAYQTTTRNARRCSAATGYLKSAQSRPNLRIETGCLVRRITFEGTRATGVAYTNAKGVQVARAAREVLVAAGAIGSPKIMMLSGVGPAAHLKGHGIDVIHNLPGVGENLTDHFGIDIIAELKRHESLDKFRKPHWAVWSGLRYALFRSGPLTSNIVEGGAFWYSDRDKAIPDLQFHFLCGAGAEEGVSGVSQGASGITLNSYTLRPKSRGTVRLRSADATDAPIIDPNYLSHPDDIKTSAQGVRISMEIFSQPSLQAYVRCMAAPSAPIEKQSELEAFARQHGRTSYHPVGTCKMGSDAMAVVDPQLRARGLDGIRICDSSVMPSLIGSNTNAATIMIAEKAADLVRGNR